MEVTGIIIKAVSGFYYVNIGNKTVECKAKGVFRKKGISPLVGDKVSIITFGEKGVIENIFERKNKLVRPAIANLDSLFIVSSYAVPSPNLLLLDRMICLCEFGGIEPIILFNKSDLGSFEELSLIYRNAGFKNVVVSCKTGQGIDEIKEYTKGKISAFAGNSGVGKSSIINLVFPQFNLATGDVSVKLGRGKHTTRKVELFKTESGYIADTPGFSSLEFETYDMIPKDKLAYTFREFVPFLQDCKFTSCSHTTEKGCAILKKLLEGKVCKTRHDNYCTLYDEIKDIKSWKTKKK